MMKEVKDEITKWVPKLDDKIKALNSSRVFKKVTPKGDLSWYIKWASSIVIFNNINISNPLQRSITSAEIVDNFGCSQQVTFTYEFPEVYTYTVDVDSKDIDCSANTSGEVTFTVNPSDVAGDLSSSNPAQLYIKANGRPYEYYQTLIPILKMVLHF